MAAAVGRSAAAFNPSRDVAVEVTVPFPTSEELYIEVSTRMKGINQACLGKALSHGKARSSWLPWPGLGRVGVPACVLCVEREE